MSTTVPSCETESGPGPPIHLVGARGAEDLVRAGAAYEGIITGFAVQLIDAGAARNAVVAVAR